MPKNIIITLLLHCLNRIRTDWPCPEQWAVPGPSVINMLLRFCLKNTELKNHWLSHCFLFVSDTTVDRDEIQGSGFLMQTQSVHKKGSRHRQRYPNRQAKTLWFEYEKRSISRGKHTRKNAGKLTRRTRTKGRHRLISTLTREIMRHRWK